MNKAKRKELQKAIDLLNEALSIIENIKDEEQEAYDNLSENLQSSEMGQKMESAVSYMEDATSSIEDVISNIESAME